MLIERYFEVKDQRPRQRLLTGHDLIKVLKLEPSGLFGKILSSVEEAAALGKIKTKEEALAYATLQISRHRVLSIKGSAAGFLNGITSNTLDAPLNAFLNLHGRIIATFRQKKISDDEYSDQCALDCQGKVS